MKKMIDEIIARFRDWKRLREFEREFYSAFPKDDSDYNIVTLTIVIGILLALIIVSLLKQ